MNCGINNKQFIIIHKRKRDLNVLLKWRLLDARYHQNKRKFLSNNPICQVRQVGILIALEKVMSAEYFLIVCAWQPASGWRNRAVMTDGRLCLDKGGVSGCSREAGKA